MKFVRAWRVLDVAAMRYQSGFIDKAGLIDAVERGEAAIAEFEDKYDTSAADDKRSNRAAAASPDEAPLADRSADSATLQARPPIAPADAEVGGTARP